MITLIEPRDPLIARDGRPFTPDPGARATSLPFPFPSTTTGGFRTRIGQDATGRFVGDPAALKQVAVRGPLLVELDAHNRVSWFAPAPLDCVFLAKTDTRPARRKQLVPARVPAGWLCDPLDQCSGVAVFSPPENEDSKPESGPAFWKWSEFHRWLEAPASSDFSKEQREALGLSGPTLDARTHVALKLHSSTAEEGRLFSTRGLDFRATSETPDGRRHIHRLALALWSDNAPPPLKGTGALGGERRLMGWSSSDTPLPAGEALAKRIGQDGVCRLILLTPALFKAGWRPTWLFENARSQGLELKLRAACVGRAGVVSGWNFEAPRGPKPTRRLAPSGSTYFLRFTSGTPAQIEAWVHSLWLAPVSDDAQDRRDGFGLAAFGTSSKEDAPLC